MKRLRQFQGFRLPRSAWVVLLVLPACVAGLALVTATAGGSRAAVVGGTSGGRSQTFAVPAYCPGELVVKFRPEFRQFGARLRRNQASQPSIESANLQALHERYHVGSMRPLFTSGGPDAANQSRTVISASDWTAHLTDLRQRFATRARRASGDRPAPDLSTVYVLTVPEDTDIRQLAAEYAADPSVEYAQPNYTFQVAFIPNDTFFNSSGSWGQDFPDLWGLHNIHADAAWDLTTGAGTTVAVIDTGLLLGHPDIAGNVWTNPGEIPE